MLKSILNQLYYEFKQKDFINRTKLKNNIIKGYSFDICWIQKLMIKTTSFKIKLMVPEHEIFWKVQLFYFKIS